MGEDYSKIPTRFEKTWVFFELFPVICQNFILHVERGISGNFFSLKKQLVSSSEVEPETHNLLFKYVSARLTKLGSTCPVEPFEENISNNIVFLQHFHRMIDNNSYFCIKILARTSKLPSACPQEHLEETFNQNLQIFLSFFGYWAKYFGRLSKFVRWVVKRSFEVSKKMFEGIFFTLWYGINVHFFAFSASGFRSFGKVHKTTFNVSKKTYVKIFKLKIYNSFNFWWWANTVRHFAKIFSAGLSRVDFICRRKILRKKEFQMKKNVCTFCPLSEKNLACLVSGKTFSPNFSKLFSSCPNNFFEKKF